MPDPIASHRSARFIAGLALLPGVVHHAAAPAMSEAAIMKIFWTDLRRCGGEGSTDGSHPDDLGCLRQAGIFAKVLQPLLPTESHQ